LTETIEVEGKRRYYGSLTRIELKIELLVDSLIIELTSSARYDFDIKL